MSARLSQQPDDGPGAGHGLPRFTGQHLRQIRLGMGLSKSALARSLGVSRQTLHRWETGEHAIAQPAMLELALKALGALNGDHQGPARRRRR